MKSYLLIGTKGRDPAETALDKILPGQRHPWLLTDSVSDPIAYVHVEADGRVAADMSGRHYEKDDVVLALLRSLRSEVGGRIERSD